MVMYATAMSTVVTAACKCKSGGYFSIYVSQCNTWVLTAVACMTNHGLIGLYAHGACRFESGDFFALDMGGTNFRTVYVNLSDAHGKMVNILFLYISSTHAQINLMMPFYLNAQLVSIYSTMLSVVSTCALQFTVQGVFRMTCKWMSFLWERKCIIYLATSSLISWLIS